MITAPMARRPRLSSVREAYRAVLIVLGVVFLPIAFAAMFAWGWSQ